MGVQGTCTIQHGISDIGDREVGHGDWVQDCPETIMALASRVWKSTGTQIPNTSKVRHL
jgi:hypothetical protein